MDRPLLHRRARAAQGRPQEIQATKALPAVDRLWAQAGGRRCSSAAGCASCGTMRAVCPETIYRWVTPAGARERWARCLPRGAQAAPRHGGRRTSASRSPAECPFPNARRRPTAGARSAARSTASSVGCNLHTEVERSWVPHGPRRSGQDRRRERRGAAGHVLAAAGRRRVRHARQRHRVRPPRKAARSPSPTRTPAGSGKQREPQRNDPPVSAQTLRDTDGHGKGGGRSFNNRPMRVLGYCTPAEAFADELLELQDQQGCCTSK